MSRIGDPGKASDDGETVLKSIKTSHSAAHAAIGRGLRTSLPGLVLPSGSVLSCPQI